MNLLKPLNIQPDVSMRKPITSLQANGRKYVAQNPNGKLVHEYHDLDQRPYFQNKYPCVDYLLYVEEDQRTYLIELKGKEIEHAYEQILSTFKVLRTQKVQFTAGKTRGRIVLSRVSGPDLRTASVKKSVIECKKLGLEILRQSRTLEETI